MKLIFTEHADSELRRRGIDKKLVNFTVNNPEQVVGGYGERYIYSYRLQNK